MWIITICVIPTMDDNAIVVVAAMQMVALHSDYLMQKSLISQMCSTSEC